MFPFIEIFGRQIPVYALMAILGAAAICVTAVILFFLAFTARTIATIPRISPTSAPYPKNMDRNTYEWRTPEYLEAMKRASSGKNYEVTKQ